MKRLFNRENSEELKERRLAENTPRITLSFYMYAQILNPSLFRDHLYSYLSHFDVCGRIYVAKEGVNAQLNVPENKYAEFEEFIRGIDYFTQMRLNIAIDKKAFSFYKLIIKLKSKIVADGLDDSTFDSSDAGVHLDAAAFNALTSQDDSILVDMRNHYESEVGYFEGAICPDVETFRESLPIIEALFNDKKDKPLVMYCTGGIRCEKASAYFKHKGFQRVYQLNGGIIEYARQVKQDGIPNKFIGKNFVFDERMGERVSSAIIAKCHQCGTTCDRHVNCTNNACHILFIQCPECAKNYEGACSKKCASFLRLPDVERKANKNNIEFNGTKFGKGRYKALTADEELDLS